MASDFTSLYRKQLQAANPLSSKQRRVARAFGVQMPTFEQPEPIDDETLPIPDPLGFLSRHRQAVTAPPPVTPEEEAGLLHSAVGGLEWLGQTLDKPGAAVRGLLAGQPEQLANLIPFSDTLGITDPKTRVSGRDLLEKAGILGQNTPGLDWGDVGGFAAEVVTDPLLFLKAAPLTVKGAAKAAQMAEEASKAGKTFETATKYITAGLKDTKQLPTYRKTAQSVADQIRAEERGVFGFGLPGLPFAKPTAEHAATITFGAGSETAAKALEALAYKNPIVPGLRGMFSSVAGGDYTGVGQQVKDAAWLERQRLEGALTDIAPAFRDESQRLFGKFQEIAQHFQANGDARSYGDFSRWMAESMGEIPKGQEVLDGMLQRMGIASGVDLPSAVGDATELASQYHGFFDQLRTIKDQAKAKYMELGGSPALLEDTYAQHFPRRGNVVLDTLESAAGGEPNTQRFRHNVHRSEVLTNFPGNSERINRAVTDPLVSGRDVTLLDDGTSQVEKIAGKDLKRRLELRLSSMGVEIPEKANLLDLQEMYLRQQHVLPSIQEAQGSGIRTAEDAAKDAAEWTFQGRQAVSTKIGEQKYVTRFRENRAREFVKYAKRLPDQIASEGLFNRPAVDDWFSYMHSMLGDIATLEGAQSFLGQPGVISEAGKAGSQSLAKAWNGAKFRKDGLLTWAAQQYPDVAAKGEEELAKFVASLGVSENAAGAIRAFGESLEPKNKTAIGKLFDKATSVYKWAWTMPMPAFHVRNMGGGLFNAWAQSKVPLHKIVSSMVRATEHFRTRGTKALKYGQEGVDQGILAGFGPLAEIATPAAAAKQSKVPEGFMGGVFDWLTRPTEAVKHPFKTVKDTAENAYGFVEGTLRLGYYNALRESGYSPAAAKHLVTQAMFDYTKASPLERSTFKKVVPFWGWLRSNLPYQITNLAARPGGRTAQTVRAYNDFSAGGQGEGYAPSFLREGLAIPIQSEGANTTFLRQAGLPLEDLNKFVFKSSGLPAAGRTAEKFGAGLHPGILAGIESWAGRQMWSGRDIKDLESTTEKLGASAPLPMVDRLLHYSPLSTAASAALTVKDPRKTPWQKLMNLTTGAKTATYDTEKWKMIDLQNALKAEADQNPIVREMVRQYIPERYQALPEAEKAKAGIRKADQLLGALKKKREREKKE
jgi:hypothetical protein